MLFVARKERGVFLSVSQAMSALDAAQLEKFEEDFKQYKENEIIADSLSPFKVTNLIFTTSALGALTFQTSAYIHFLGDLFTVSGSSIYKATAMKETEKADLLTNQLRPISVTNPYYENTENGLQFYPQTTMTGYYSFLQRPATPILNYIQTGRTITYISAGSVQLEWYDVYIDNIISRALAYLGIYMNEDQIIKFSQLKQQQTES
jgi:hypothetical protein